MVILYEPALYRVQNLGLSIECDPSSRNTKIRLRRTWGRFGVTCSTVLQAEVIAFQDECSKDLAAAEPIIREAEAALNSLDKASLGELKSFGSPAADVAAVVSACMVLTAAGGKIPKVPLGTLSSQCSVLPEGLCQPLLIKFGGDSTLG